jgi:magnesium chelatase family protein
VQRYKRRISGPMLDRIDMHVEVPRVDVQKLVAATASYAMRTGTAAPTEEPSAAVRARVQAARDRQFKRLSPFGLYTNAEMHGALIKRLCPLHGEAHKALADAAKRMNLSARATLRVWKLARTIADLDGVDEIVAAHVMEAANYRER